MTYPTRAPAPPAAKKGWPVHGWADLAVDIMLAVTLCTAEAVVLLVGTFGFGMGKWQEQSDIIDKITLDEIARTKHFALIMFAGAVVTLLLRLRWTAAGHVVVVLAALALVASDHHDYNVKHAFDHHGYNVTPDPRLDPTDPNALCFSGAHTCN